MKFLNIIIIYLFLFNTAHAADWYLLKTNNNKEELYIDRDSIEDLKNESVKVSFKFNTVGDSEKFVRISTIIRCKDKSSTTQSIRLYSYKQDQNFEYDQDQQTTDPINFDTRYGYVFNYVCKAK